MGTHSFKKSLAVLLMISICIWSIMVATDPTENITSILLVFLLLYIGSVLITRLLLRLVVRFMPRRLSGGRAVSMSPEREYYLASVVGFAPVCLLAMRSLNALRFFDVALVILLTVLGAFYVVKQTK